MEQRNLVVIGSSGSRTAQAEEVEKEKTRLEEETRKKDIELNQAEEDKKKLEEQAEQAEKEKTKLEEETRKKDIKLNQAENEKKKLEEQAEEAEKEKTRLEEETRKKDVKLYQVEEEKKKLAGQAGEAEKEKKRLEEASRKIDVQLNQAEEDKTKLEEQAREAHKEKTRLQEETRKSDAKLNQAEEEKKRLEGQAEEAEKEKKRLEETKRELDQAKKEKKRLEEDEKILHDQADPRKYQLGGICISNKLTSDISDIEITSVISNKRAGGNNDPIGMTKTTYRYGTELWFVDTTASDKTTGNWLSREIFQGNEVIAAGKSGDITCKPWFNQRYRHYWMFKCKIGGVRMKMDMDNKMVNVYDLDALTKPDLVLEKNGKRVWLTMKLVSGTAWVYMIQD